MLTKKSLQSVFLWLGLFTLIATLLSLSQAGEPDGKTIKAAAVQADTASAADIEAPRDFSQPVREPIVGTKIQKTRAYWGAPPPVPHSIQSERTSKGCLGCHALENNLKLKKRAIAPMPHTEFTECMQCHVNGNRKKVEEFRPNDFVGLDFPGPGSRASDTSPPTIPHHTFMRDNCRSCHGPAGDYAVKTPHPERSQCRQCHVAEATQIRVFPVAEASIAPAEE